MAYFDRFSDVGEVRFNQLFQNFSDFGLIHWTCFLNRQKPYCMSRLLLSVSLQIAQDIYQCGFVRVLWMVRHAHGHESFERYIYIYIYI